MRGVLQRDDVALQLASFGSLSGSGNLGICQSGERVFIAGDEGAVFCGGQQLRREGLAERGLLFVQLLERDLIGVRKISSGVHELLVVVVNQAIGLGIKLQGVALLVDGFDALEQFGIEKDRIGVGGQLGSFDLLDFLQLRIEVGTSNGAERGHGAIKQPASLLHGGDGVFEGWRRGIFRDALHFVALLRHAGFNGRLVVGVFDLVEGRRVERQRAFGVERVTRAEFALCGVCGNSSGCDSHS